MNISDLLPDPEIEFCFGPPGSRLSTLSLVVVRTMIVFCVACHSERDNKDLYKLFG